MSEEHNDREPDFVDKALHSFDHVLDVVHDRVLRPLLLAGRAIAFGFVLVLVALLVVSALVIGLVRLLNIYLFAGHEWLTYAVVGVISLVVGLFIWRRRNPVKLRK